MDKECIHLCDELNRLPTAKTIESCCGHKHDDFRIYFLVSDPRVMNFLARLTSHNYSRFAYYEASDGTFKRDWTITLDITDIHDFNTDVMFCLAGNKDNPLIYNEAEQIASCLKKQWEDFCRYVLKCEPFYKPDVEYNAILAEYMNDSDSVMPRSYGEK